MPAVDKPLGFHKVAKHYYFPGWHQPSSILELIVNLESWNGLAKEQRAAIETACQATTLWSLTRALAIQGPALDFFEKEGVTLHRWPPELLARFRATTADPNGNALFSVGIPGGAGGREVTLQAVERNRTSNWEVEVVQ